MHARERQDRQRAANGDLTEADAIALAMTVSAQDLADVPAPTGGVVAPTGTTPAQPTASSQPVRCSGWCEPESRVRLRR